jgi:hypothetical protein
MDALSAEAHNIASIGRCSRSCGGENLVLRLIVGRISNPELGLPHSIQLGRPDPRDSRLSCNAFRLACGARALTIALATACKASGPGASLQNTSRLPNVWAHPIRQWRPMGP